MKLLTTKQWEKVAKISCEKCSDKNGCDRVKYLCPKENY